MLGVGRALSACRRRHIRAIIEGRGVRRGVRLMFLATCLALLERKKRDHHAMVVANRRPPVMSGRPHRTQRGLKPRNLLDR